VFVGAVWPKGEPLLHASQQLRIEDNSLRGEARGHRRTSSAPTRRAWRRPETGRLRVIAGIEAPAVIEPILEHLAGDAETDDPAHPSRAPPDVTCSNRPVKEPLAARCGSGFVPDKSGHFPRPGGRVENRIEMLTYCRVRCAFDPIFALHRIHQRLFSSAC
jgi:hypothetical protein